MLLIRDGNYKKVITILEYFTVFHFQDITEIFGRAYFITKRDLKTRL